MTYIVISLIILREMLVQTFVHWPIFSTAANGGMFFSSHVTGQPHSPARGCSTCLTKNVLPPCPVRSTLGTDSFTDETFFFSQQPILLTSGNWNNVIYLYLYKSARCLFPYITVRIPYWVIHGRSSSFAIIRLSLSTKVFTNFSSSVTTKTRIHFTFTFCVSLISPISDKVCYSPLRHENYST